MSYNKEEVRVLGIDDVRFDRGRQRKTLLIGVVMRGYKQIDGLLSTWIEIDGMDVTDKIIEMIRSSSHYYQLRIIMLSGVTFAGFNVADPYRIYEELSLPVIIVIDKYPDIEGTIHGLKKFVDADRRIEIIKSLPSPIEVKSKYGNCYIQPIGIDTGEAKELVRRLSINSKLPEPVRVANLIAHGIYLEDPFI